MTRASRPWSIVTEFSSLEAKEVTLSKSCLIAHLEWHHIGIVPDTSSLRICQVLPPEPRRACKISTSSDTSYLICPFINDRQSTPFKKFRLLSLLTWHLRHYLPPCSPCEFPSGTAHILVNTTKYREAISISVFYTNADSLQKMQELCFRIADSSSDAYALT